MLAFLFSQWGITTILIIILSAIFIYQYLKWKWRREGAKRVENSIRNQEYEQRKQADKELAQSNAENYNKSIDSKFKWLRKYARIKN